MALNNLGFGIVFSATDNASGTIRQISRGFLGLDETIKGASERMAGAVGVSTEQMVTSLKRIAGGLVAVAVGAKIASIGISSLQALFGNVEEAADLESSLTNIAQKGGIATDQLVELRTSLRGLTTVLPLSTKGLADIATAAAQIGVKGVKDLSVFSLSVAKLAKISEFTGEEAALTMGRLRKAFKLPIEDVDSLSSVLIGLGDSMATNAVQVSEVLKRFAPFAGAIGVTADEAAAFAATLAAAGVQTEAAGSGLNRLFATAQKNVGAFAKIAGVSESAFKDAFGKEPAKTMTFFLSKLREVAKADLPRALEDIGLGGTRNIQIMSVLTSQFGELNVALGESSRLFIEGEEANDKFKIKMQELNAQIEVLEGNLGSIREIIGEVLQPIVESFVEISNDLLGAFINLPGGVKKFLVIGAALGATLLTILGILIAVAGAVIVGTALWATFGTVITAAAISAGASVAAFGIVAFAAISPFLPLVGGVLAALALLAIAWETNLFGVQAFGDSVKFLGGLLLTIFGGIADVVKGAFSVVFALITGDFQLLVEGIAGMLNGLVDFLNKVVITSAQKIAVALRQEDLAIKLDTLKIARFTTGKVDFALTGDASQVIAEKSASAVSAAEARTGKLEGALTIPESAALGGGGGEGGLTRADIIALIEAFERRQQTGPGNVTATFNLDGRTVAEVIAEQNEERGTRRGRLSQANRR